MILTAFCRFNFLSSQSSSEQNKNGKGFIPHLCSHLTTRVSAWYVYLLSAGVSLAYVLNWQENCGMQWGASCEGCSVLSTPKSTQSCQALYIWLRHRSLHSAAADWHRKHHLLLKQRASLQGRKFLTINFCMWTALSHQTKAKNSL